MSADPRKPLRWVPIGLGLAVAVLLIIIQLTRTTEAVETTRSPLDTPPGRVDAATAKETPPGSPSSLAGDGGR